MTAAPPGPFSYPTGDVTLVRGQGVRLWDDTGRRYLDGISGTFNLPLGHGHPRVVAAVREQAGTLAYASSSFQTRPVRELAAALVRLSPPHLTRVHLRSTGGSTANEGAIRIAQHATGRRDVVTMFRGHLGQTIATAGMSGYASRRAPFPASVAGRLVVPDPYCFRCFYRQRPQDCGLWCVERIADFLRYAGDGQAAAVLVEPVCGVGGNVVPPPGYLAELRRFCDERGIVLVFDEVQTAFGRTGHMFAADHFGVAPDMITVAKGLSGLGLPLGAVLLTDRLAGLDRQYHSFTSGGQPLAAAAALATLEVITAPGFLDRVRRVGGLLMGELTALRSVFP
ncbi:MAG TPA: aspartate aminotransferase family protein, partial [Frankiaceae bacterium]|nr:aspartate aminotransferase family protein [Frankiaceae bacterium]